MKAAAAFALLATLSVFPAFAADEQEMIQAANDENLSKVKELLEAGANPNATDRTGATAMHHAAWDENVAIIQLLLDHGGKPSVDIRETEHNGTPLEWVTFKGRPAIVKLLLDNGSKVYDLDWQIATKFAEQGPPKFLEKTKKEDYIQILEFFKAAGFGDRQDLFSACTRGDLAMAERVLAAKPESLQELTKPGDEFGEGITPVLFAAGCPSKQILSLIIDAGAPLTATDPKGNSPLHRAAAAGAWQNISLLLAKGLALETKNADGKTALDLAAENEKWLAVEVLMQAGATPSDELNAKKHPKSIARALKKKLDPIVLAPLNP